MLPWGGSSRHLKCNLKAVVVAAVGKWESRVFCGIPKRRGKVCFPTFPRSVFSTAVWLARFCALRRRQSLGHLGAQPPVGQLVDVLQLLIDGFRQRKWVQRLPQALQLGHAGRMSLRRGGHALQRGLGRVIDPSQFRSHSHLLHQFHRGEKKIQPQAQFVAVEIVEGLDDLYRHELRLWLNLFLPSVKLVKKVRVGSKLRRVYDTPQTPLQRVASSPQAHAARVAELQSLRESLNPFALAKAIDQKLEHIYELANRRLSPKVPQGLPATERTKSSQPNGGGKDAAWKSRKTDFSTPLGNPAEDTGFPLSHRRNNNSLKVTFQMARRPTPRLHS